MTEEEWARFVSGDGLDVRRICRASRSVADHLRGETDIVRIRRDYALKIIYKHNVLYYHLPLIEVAILNGVALDDRQNHVTFIYDDRQVTNWSWQATIKINSNKNEIYLTTFHKIMPKDAARKVRKNTIIY